MRGDHRQQYGYVDARLMVCDEDPTNAAGIAAGENFTLVGMRAAGFNANAKEPQQRLRPAGNPFVDEVDSRRAAMEEEVDLHAAPKEDRPDDEREQTKPEPQSRPPPFQHAGPPRPRMIAIGARQWIENSTNGMGRKLPQPVAVAQQTNRQGRQERQEEMHFYHETHEAH